VLKAAQKRLFFLRRLKKFGMDSVILTNFYRCTIASILTGCITVWYGSCTAKDRKALRSVVRTAEFIIGRGLPALQDTYHTRCLRKACRILKDCYHPSCRLCCYLAGDTGASALEHIEWRTVSFRGPSGFSMDNDTVSALY